MLGRFYKKKKGKKAAEPRRHARLRWHMARRVAGLSALAAGLGLLTYITFGTTLIADTRGRVVSAFYDRSAAAGFALRDILVTGRGRTGEQELVEALGIAPGTPIFSISLEAARARLDTLTWIESAHISRHLPDTLLIHLVERQPVALWQFRKKIALIDIDGEVITDKDLDAFAGLPLVVGEDAPAQTRSLMALLAAEPALAAKIASATRVGNRRWDLRLENGITVRLPEDDLELALSRLGQAARQDRLLEKDIAVIDLRLPDRMTVTPRPSG